MEMTVARVLMAAVTGRAVVALMMVRSPVGGPEGCLIIKKQKLRRTRSSVELPGKGDFVLWGFRALRNLQKCLQTHTGAHTHTHTPPRSKIQKENHKIASNKCLIAHLQLCHYDSWSVAAHYTK